jgi:hypothetical protein
MELLDDRMVLSAVVAIPICAALLALLAEIGIRHVRTSGGKGWHDRLPVVGLDGLETGSRDGQLYQGFFLCLFVVLPILSLAHFISESQEAVVVNLVTRETGTILRPPGGPNFWSLAGEHFRVGREFLLAPPPGGKAPTDPFQGMITWIPVWELLAYGLLLAVALWRCAVLFAALRAPTGGATEPPAR